MEAVAVSGAAAALHEVAGDARWWVPLRPALALARAAAAAADMRAALTAEAGARNLRTATGQPLQFVAADDAGDRPYEAHIAATGRVPTRENRHDLFNALIWFAYPRAKAALNAAQAAAIARDGVGARRGPVRDAATLIDESGLLLASPDPAVFEALAAHDWTGLLVAQRGRWGRDVLPLVFGHALLDKLCGPFKAITAAVVPLHVNRLDGVLDSGAIDQACARFVSRPQLAPGDLLHLPVLGIPGWCDANEDPRFYADERVFRRARVPVPRDAVA